MSNQLMFTVDAEALCQVLLALNGPGHLIRELQATRDKPPILTGNPIDTLLTQYNAQVEAYKDGTTAHDQTDKHEAAPMSEKDVLNAAHQTRGHYSTIDGLFQFSESQLIAFYRRILAGSAK